MGARRLGIVAGAGALPRLLFEHAATVGEPPCVIGFEGIALPWEPPGTPHVPFEKPGRIFRALRQAGCDRVVLAGSMRRPKLNPWRFDWKFWTLAWKLLPAMKGGDDGTLRAVAAMFEGEGLTLMAAHEVRDDLLIREGVLTRARPTGRDRKDAERAAGIVAALGGQDVGQGAVVAGGLCLAVETIQGTDAMLAYVAETGDAFRGKAKGVFYKAPKPGQDRRMDLPAIGPDTVAAAARAGLAGIAVEAGGVLILDREATVAAADDAGLFIWARPAGG